ncbi:retrotransposon protein, putative, ty1-copia subclass [Tanacetum coccineum]|uniref:Retrotransposon protein, putative, ty1-copia subclass n=1 Tax=Tanacetum coccineum TaxID=301880 RepID=A0ABQ5CGE1_9ASTR
MVRSMMSQTTLPKSFWDYALESAARILNMVPTKKGCEALVKRDTLTKLAKLEPKSFKCIFIGYPKETMGHYFYNPSENKVFIARNAEFFESNLIDQEASGSLEDLEIIQEEDTNPSLDTSLNHEVDDQEIDEPQSDINPIRKPANYKDALLDPESEKWLAAMNVEMQSMKDNDVWELVELPPNAKTIGHKWLFKKKTDMDGAVHTFKSRLVSHKAIRILISIAALYDYDIWQIDVKTAFLNGHLTEEVYMKQPEGFVNPKYPNHACKLKRSIYGLKKSSRQWNKRFDDEIKKFGFTQNRDEPCVYRKASGSYVTFLILYVDDILIMGNNIPMLQDVKSYLGRCFAMKDLGESAYILGIKIYRDRSKRLIGLCQSAYIEKILKRYYMENSKHTEYIAAFDASKEAVWIHKFISWLNVVPTIEEPVTMYCDNTGAITIANDHGVAKGARHFCVKVHYLRETIDLGDVRIEQIDTDDNLADPFTKALAFPKHSELTRKIGLIPASSLM